MKLLGKERVGVIEIYRFKNEVILVHEDGKRETIPHFDSHLHAFNKSHKDKPETLKQAKTWENVKRKYIQDGLCSVCASQAAYGHQLGFTKVWPPCSNCKDRVSTFPVEAGNGWRRHERGDRRPDASDVALQGRPQTK